MTCEEFGRVLPELEGGLRKEQNEHLKSCSACAELVSDLNAISQEARWLAEAEEPSARVWNSIEIALRREGLIHQPAILQRRPEAKWRRWRAGFLVPLAATVALIFGILIYQQGGRQPRTKLQASNANPPVVAPTQAGIVADDEQLLNFIASRAPSLRAGYAADFKAVDEYIRDAEQSARSNPNDEVAQQYLVNAYEQKAMLVEMALDRSLP